MRRSSCRSKSFEREAEGERKLNRVISREREKVAEKRNIPKHIRRNQQEVVKVGVRGKWVFNEFVLLFNGVAVSCAKGASQALSLHVSHLSFVFPPREAV